MMNNEEAQNKFRDMMSQKIEICRDLLSSDEELALAIGFHLTVFTLGFDFEKMSVCELEKQFEEVIDKVRSSEEPWIKILLDLWEDAKDEFCTVEA